MVGKEAFIAVYMMASGRHGTLYVGVTSMLPVRVAQHREGTLDGFTKEYGVTRLVWFEIYDDMASATRREKAIKKYRRDWKILIERENPAWADLYPKLFL
ncbi:MAG TPA: GIY-YIG nuclease family protein [Caulobacteraceae bacterium]|jgi:putative endonuclease|nr:GIY-YIG nuclease family protein [Caulobacteraceae bacterium]